MNNFTVNSVHPKASGSQDNAQPGIDLEEFTEKLDSLCYLEKFRETLASLDSSNFNKCGTEKNNKFLVTALYDIYAPHYNNENPLNKELPILIDNWIHTRSIQPKRIDEGMRIIQLLDQKCIAAEATKKEYKAFKEQLSETAPQTAPARIAPARIAKKQSKEAYNLLNDLHKLLRNIDGTETSKVEEKLLEYRASLSKDDFEELKQKRGDLLPQDVFNEIVAYCCSQNDDLKPEPLSSVLQNLHTLVKGISAANNLSLYENELIRIMVEIRDFTNKSKVPMALGDALDKFKFILPATIPMKSLTKLAQNKLLKFFKTPVITFKEAHDRWKNLQSEIMTAEIESIDRLELPEDWIDSMKAITKSVNELDPKKKKQLSKLSDDSLCKIVDFCLVEKSDICQNNLIALLTISHNIFGTITIDGDSTSLYEQELIRAMAEIKEIHEENKRNPKKIPIKIIDWNPALDKFTQILGLTIKKERLVELVLGKRNTPINNTIRSLLADKYNRILNLRGPRSKNHAGSRSG